MIDLIASFISLTFLEIILGIDNLIMIAVVVNTLPESKRDMTRKIGIFLALFMRVCFLFTMSWIAGLIEPIITIKGVSLSMRDIIMLLGGLFLVYKGIHEIYRLIFPEHKEINVRSGSVVTVIIQICIFDLIFSIDSVITAIGMSNNLYVMVSAIVIAMMFMLFASKTLVDITKKYISLKVLALGFTALIGVLLVSNGLHKPIPKSYIYLSVLFATVVEVLVIVINRKKRITYNID